MGWLRNLLGGRGFRLLGFWTECWKTMGVWDAVGCPIRVSWSVHNLGEIPLRSLEEEAHSLCGDGTSRDRRAKRLETANGFRVCRHTTDSHQGRRLEWDRHLAFCTGRIHVVGETWMGSVGRAEHWERSDVPGRRRRGFSISAGIGFAGKNTGDETFVARAPSTLLRSRFISYRAGPNSTLMKASVCTGPLAKRRGG